MATRKADLGFGGHFQFSNMELLQGSGEQKDDMTGLMSEVSFWLCKDRAGSLLLGQCINPDENQWFLG